MTFIISNFIILALLSIFEIESKKLNKIIYIYISLSLFLYAALVDDGPDYLNYVSGFKNQSFRDIGARYIASFLHIFTDDSRWFFILFAMLTVSLSCIYISLNTYMPWLALAVFISNYYILHDYIQIRVAVSAMVFLFMLQNISKKKYFKAVCLYIFSVLFHYSAVIGGIAFFTSKKKVNKYLYIAMFILLYIMAIKGIGFAFLLSKIPIPVIGNTINTYLELLQENKFNNIKIFNPIQILNSFIAFLLIIYSDYLEEKIPCSILYINIYLTGVLSFLIFNDIPVVAFRVKEYFLITEIPLISSILLIFEEELWAKIIILFVLSCVLIINIFYNKLIY